MDLLSGYGDEDASATEPDEPQQAHHQGHQQQQQQQQEEQRKDEQQPAIKLPPPNFDDEDMPASSSMNPMKRSFNEVSGCTIVGSVNKGAAKSQKPSWSPASPTLSNTASARARATSNPNLLLPPQLRGRPNVATEDVGRLFSQGSLEAMRSTKVQQHKLQAAKGSDRVT